MAEVEKVSNIGAKLLMLESYLITYGIADVERLEASRPLVHIAMHPKENVTEHSENYTLIRRYYRAKLERSISLDKFLELPREYVQLLLRIAAENASAENRAANAIADGLDL